MLKKVFFLATMVILLFALSCKSEKAEDIRSSLSYSDEATFKGIAYIQGACDHITVLNLEDSQLRRILHKKRADTFTLSDTGNTLHVMSADGNMKKLELADGTQSKWMKVGEKICGSALGPSGKLWILDEIDSSLKIYDPATGIINTEKDITSGTCDIAFSRERGKAFLLNRTDSTISVIDTSTFTETAKISGVGNSIHGADISPSGMELWIAEGNEYKDGKPYGVGYAKTTPAFPGGINVLNLKDGKLNDFIYVGGNVMDLEFSPDGKYAFLSVSQMPKYWESTLAVVDVEKRRVIKEYRLCNVCHNWKDVKLPDNKTIAGKIRIDWKARSFNKAVEESEDIPLLQEGQTIYM